jgi:DNA-binding NtrC family response regulator
MSQIHRTVRAQCILVVDDDEAICDVVREFLTGHDFHVQCATSAADARAALQRRRFDVVILDVMLPGEYALELAEDVVRTGARVILTSGHPEAIKRADELPYLFLRKPFRLEQIASLVRAAPGSRSDMAFSHAERGAERGWKPSKS